MSHFSVVPSRPADADAVDVAVECKDLADDGVVVELRRVALDGRELRRSVDPHVVDAGAVTDRLECQPVLVFELRCRDRRDTPLDNGEHALICNTFRRQRGGAMVGMPGDAQRFEDDERDHVRSEPAVETRVELGFRHAIE